jgi:hypothetical protein
MMSRGVGLLPHDPERKEERRREHNNGKTI